MQATTVDTATKALRELLARGQYRPGDQPPERELAQALGLARPTVREAIHRLTEAGLLEPRRGSGTYVADIDLHAVFAVRLQLEPYAAGLAADHHDARTVDQLTTLAADLDRTLEDPEAFAAIDLAIHRTIAAATGNAVLTQILDHLTELAQLSRSITSVDRDARVATREHLHELVDALRESDSGAASSAMQKHLDAVRAIAVRHRPLDRRIGPLSHTSSEPER